MLHNVVVYQFSNIISNLIYIVFTGSKTLAKAQDNLRNMKQKLTVSSEQFKYQTLNSIPVHILSSKLMFSKKILCLRNNFKWIFNIWNTRFRENIWISWTKNNLFSFCLRMNNEVIITKIIFFLSKNLNFCWILPAEY